MSLTCTTFVLIVFYVVLLPLTLLVLNRGDYIGIKIVKSDANGKINYNHCTHKAQEYIFRSFETRSLKFFGFDSIHNVKVDLRLGGLWVGKRTWCQFLCVKCVFKSLFHLSALDFNTAINSGKREWFIS